MSGRNVTCVFSQKSNVRNYALHDKNVFDVSCVLLSSGKRFAPMMRRRFVVVARILASLIDLGVVLLRQLTNKNNEQRVKNIEPLKTKIQIPSTEIDKTEKKVNLRGSSDENKLVATIQMKVF